MGNQDAKAVHGTEESLNGIDVNFESVGQGTASDTLQEAHPLSSDEQLLFGLVASELKLADAGAIVTDARIEQMRKHPVLKDLNYDVNALSTSAAAYALRPDSPARKEFWQFSPESFRPDSNRVVELAKSGAMIMAAIDQININRVLQKSYNGEGQAVSSQVDYIAYNPEKQLLLVTFKGGGSYQYSNVDTPTYIEAFKSTSIGKWINSVLKADPTKYTFTKL